MAPPELPSDEALALDESACAEAATAASAKPAKLLIVPATPVASATPDVASATLDFSKAFDRLSHSVLLDKLFRYGIRGIPLSAITSFKILSSIRPNK